MDKCRSCGRLCMIGWSYKEDPTSRAVVWALSPLRQRPGSNSRPGVATSADVPAETARPRTGRTRPFWSPFRLSRRGYLEPGLRRRGRRHQRGELGIRSAQPADRRVSVRLGAEAGAG